MKHMRTFAVGLLVSVFLILNLYPYWMSLMISMPVMAGLLDAAIMIPALFGAAQSISVSAYISVCLSVGLFLSSIFYPPCEEFLLRLVKRPKPNLTKEYFDSKALNAKL
jgi:hypothetical protein